jgi:hypothetical protein
MNRVPCFAALSVFLVLSGCSSSQKANTNPPPVQSGQKDPNKEHFDGTTKVLKSYHLPENLSKKRAQGKNARQKKESNNP